MATGRYCIEDAIIKYASARFLTEKYNVITIFAFNQAYYTFGRKLSFAKYQYEVKNILLQNGMILRTRQNTYMQNVAQSRYS